MIQIFRKEIANYFTGFMAYVCASAFVLICTLFLWFFDNEFNVFNIGTATLSSFFFIAPWILMFLVPALTMRSIAEEESNGTLQWLFTQPIKIGGIIWGKYLAVVTVLLFCIVPTFIFVYTLEQFIIEIQSLDYGVFFSGYLGLFLMGSVFASIGIFTSSMTKNQVVSYVSAVFLCFLFFYAFESLATYNLLGTADYYIQKLGMYIHFNQMLKGIIDTRDLIYFLVMISLFLVLTNYNLEKKK